MHHLRENLPASYAGAQFLHGNMITYMSDPSSSATYSDSLSINSQQMNNNCSENRACGALNFTQLQQDIPSNLGDRRDGRNDLLLTQPVQSTSTIHGGPSLEGEGLSLSLGTQIQQGMGNSSMQSGNLNPGLSSFLDKHPSISMEGHTRSVFFGQDGISLDNVGNLSPLTMASTVRTIPNAKYLKAAHQLLEEVVNVQDAVKQPGSSKEVNYEFRTKDGKDTAGDEISDRGHTNSLEAAGKSVNEPSPSERHDLQQKLTKLFSMLDEVDRRYKQYYHQMQIVISSFDAIAGDGAAKSYTAIALQTISRYFRCLRDAITSQIQAARRSHWEQDTLASSNGIKISRLRYVDPKLRQKNALQHCGIVEQNEWRAQRGLPENSVSLLRAWLFEHFLHPYPTDADKILLARQTGLSRSQVSNWFINARVRLWKPMVEEMYKQEKANAETNSSSSHEIATTSSPGDDKASKDKHKQEKDLHQSMRSDYISDVEMNGITGLSDYGYRSVQSNKRDGERFSETSESVCKIQRRFGSTDGVSLTLGLQQCEGGSFPPSNDSIDDPLAPTMESEAEEFEQHRLVS